MHVSKANILVSAGSLDRYGSVAHLVFEVQ